MKRSNRQFLTPTLALALFATAASACATAPPAELTSARSAYTRASKGPAAQLNPADVHKAKVALDSAEQSFAEDEDAQKTVDLAYIAERTAQLAEARAAAAAADQRTTKAKQDLAATQQQIATKTQADLARTREQLSDAERTGAQHSAQAGAERTAREEADRKAAAADQRAAESDRKAAEANDALAKLAAKEDERGTIITLSGSVLFRSNDATLLPSAQTRLDPVAEALIAKDRNVVVEGYTDSRGSQSTNTSLSQRRADSVRAYLVSRGFPGSRVEARGMGSDRPVAANTNAEGRANNRRVEIVIAKGSAAAR